MTLFRCSPLASAPAPAARTCKAGGRAAGRLQPQAQAEGRAGHSCSCHLACVIGRDAWQCGHPLCVPRAPAALRRAPPSAVAALLRLPAAVAAPVAANQPLGGWPLSTRPARGAAPSHAAGGGLHLGGELRPKRSMSCKGLCCCPLVAARLTPLPLPAAPRSRPPTTWRRRTASAGRCS